MDSTAETAATEAPAPWPRGVFLAAWGVFWLLMITVAVQEYVRDGHDEIWQPLLWEGSSCLVATGIVAWQWRRVAAADGLLARPWRWFGRAALRLVPMGVVFVIVVYALRHGVYAWVGQRYEHGPWPSVFLHEMLRFSIFFALFTAVMFGLRSHAALLVERVRAQRALALQQQAQLLQLTQQLAPHFLFNALNTIAATLHEDAERADRLLTRLAALLRAATDLARQPTAPLRDEIALLQGYADIMAERFGPRVQVEFDIAPDTTALAVPTLMLQPLLENCFRHGVERTTRDVRIRVAARREGGDLLLQVADDIGHLPEGGAALGTGLGTLRQRLAVSFGDHGRLTLRNREPQGVLAQVELPCAS